MSLQVALFAQTLWGEVNTGNSPLNGFAEASYTATAALAILAMNAFPLDWDKGGISVSIYVMYGCYIGYRSLYQVMITIAQWNIAKKMMGLALHVRQQYKIYAGLHMLIAAIFFCSVSCTLFSIYTVNVKLEQQAQGVPKRA
uniref:Uncharacterized protein n=1 Tax=Ditylenchus dipsaci TaxID=166011 RepID=A0A915DFZ2_9BILA